MLPQLSALPSLIDVGQVVAAILLAAVAICALKVAFLFLLLAGLIFRTRQTVGLIAMFGAWALFWKAPAISCVLIAVVAVVAIYKAATKTEPEEPAQSRLTDETST